MQSEKVPWFMFFFLSIVFFIAQHDWYFPLCSGEGFNITIDEFSQITEQGNLLRRIIFFLFGIFALVNILRSGFYRVKITGILGWFILFLISWAFLSLAWTENFSISFRRLLLFAMLCLGAFTVSQRFLPRDIALWVFFSMFCYLHIGIAAENVLGTFHPLSGDYRFAGTVHPNTQGINCALLFFASVFVLLNEKRWRWFFFFIMFESLIFLYLTKSRTSLTFAFISILIFWLLTLPSSKKMAIIPYVIFVSCLLILFSDYLFPVINHAIALGRKYSDTITLTGRIPLWKQIIFYIEKRPILGYGYDCFWTSNHLTEVANEQGWTVTQGHSAYLDISLSLGIGGAILYIIIIIIGIKQTLFYHKRSDNYYYYFLGIVLVFIALNGLLESIVIIPNQVTFISMLVLAKLGFHTRNKTKIR
jgi:exopolysaccharide production protein ExoQ